MSNLAPGPSIPVKILGRGSGSVSNLPDRYAALQKKLEDLERVHTEEKKAHKNEQDRLKRDLAASQRTASDQADQLAKLKKHHDALDNRLRELNKTRNTSDSELKDLRAKLRVSEHERQQLAAKQDGASQTAVKERDELKRQLDTMKAQASGSTLELERLQSTETELLDQLQAFKDMLALAAAQYGRMASESISKTVHRRLQLENAALKIREARLERKLANSEDQVQELAHLIRHTQEHGSLLSVQLQDAQTHARGLLVTLNDILSASASDDNVWQLRSTLHSVGESLAQERCHHVEVESRWHETSSRRIAEFADDLLHAYSAVDEEASKFQVLAVSRGIELDHTANLQTQLSAQITDMRNERDEHARIRTQADNAAELARKEATEALKEVEDVKDIHMRRIAAHEAAVLKEKEATRQAIVAVKRSKQAEQALQAEIDQLNEDLMDAMRYQTAYEQLTEQVSEAIAHSALAEEEAQKLSKFNAEILGHQNSSQKIMYVDRIRRELAETKQQLLAATRDNEAAMTDNMDLRNELDMYKSISDNHLRTGITRVTRAPLATQSMNGRHSTLSKSNVKTKMQNIPEVEVRSGDLSIADLG